MSQSKVDKLMHLAEARGVLRTREVVEAGIPRSYLSRLVERGELERIGRGLYQHTSHHVTTHHSLAIAAKRVDDSTICLLSALQFHGLTTQNPHEVWLAIGPKDRQPTVEAVNLRTVRMSGRARTEGIEVHDIEGVAVPIFGAAKTVADCFKYRCTVGKDVALEALEDYLRASGTVDELWHVAGICRVRTVIRPYLEVLA